MKEPLAGKEVILGITGGIAAYKSAELVRLLREQGAGVSVVMTDAATRFVTPLTFAALSGRPVLTSLFDDGSAGTISHIEMTAKADLLVVAPATANLIGKMASGIADDLLTTMLMAARCPVLLAPAMNCRMWENPALKRNVETLRGFGFSFVGPEKGRMACDEYGWGRMSEPADIAAAAQALIAKSGALAGRKVLITAGPTVEDIDPVRFISNRSSGLMGYALAKEAGRMGADVTLVSGPVALEPPPGVNTVFVRSAREMKARVDELFADADVLIMNAAVSDYTPAALSKRKLKKDEGELSLKLVRTDDILKGLGGKKKKGQFLVGFAAETEELEKNALKKLKDKRLDMIAANPVGGATGFGSRDNILKVYGKKGLLLDTGRVDKETAARALMDIIAASL